VCDEWQTPSPAVATIDNTVSEQDGQTKRVLALAGSGNHKDFHDAKFD